MVVSFFRVTSSIPGAIVSESRKFGLMTAFCAFLTDMNLVVMKRSGFKQQRPYRLLPITEINRVNSSSLQVPFVQPYPST